MKPTSSNNHLGGPCKEPWPSFAAKQQETTGAIHQ